MVLRVKQQFKTSHSKKILGDQKLPGSQGTCAESLGSIGFKGLKHFPFNEAFQSKLTFSLCSWDHEGISFEQNGHCTH